MQKLLFLTVPYLSLKNINKKIKLLHHWIVDTMISIRKVSYWNFYVNKMFLTEKNGTFSFPEHVERYNLETFFLNWNPWNENNEKPLMDTHYSVSPNSSKTNLEPLIQIPLLTLNGYI